MSRLLRKSRTDIKYSIVPNKRLSIFDAVDDAIKSLWRINDEEYDYICENLNEENLKFFLLEEKTSISDIKIGLTLVDDFLEKYYNQVRDNRDLKIEEITKK